MDVINKENPAGPELTEKTSHDKDHPALISFKHVNVRQSIFLLLLKLITIEIITAIVIIVFHSAMAVIKDFQNSMTPAVPFNIYIFLTLALLKTLLTGYVILEWYNEYYEISTTDVGHRKGFFFKRHERVKLEHLTAVRLEQGMLGKFFNYGTIRVFDWFRNRNYFLYQIHDPKKYERVLIHLMPTVDHSRKTIREHLIEEEEE